MRIRKAQASSFTTVQNSIINEEKLSLKAKGLFLYLFSKPDNWIFSEARMAADNKDGRDSVRSGIKELINAGLIQRIRHAPKKNRETGQFSSEVEYIIYDVLPKLDFPTVGEPNPLVRKSSSNKEKEEREPLKVLLTYTLFNSAREGDGSFLDYYLKAHDKRWKEKHRSLKNETIVEYNSLLRAMFDNDYIDGDSMVYEMSRYQNIGTKTDHHYPVFCLWLFSEKADDDYRGFNCDGSKMSVPEMFSYLEEWA